MYRGKSGCAESGTSLPGCPETVAMLRSVGDGLSVLVASSALPACKEGNSLLPLKVCQSRPPGECRRTVSSHH